MKRSLPSETDARFSGHLRHYHRQGSKVPRTWDDWVEGGSAKVHAKKNWSRILAIAVAVLALAGIVAGLAIELS